MFKGVISSETMRVAKKEYRSSDPPRENRSWGILSGFWIASIPAIEWITHTSLDELAACVDG